MQDVTQQEDKEAKQHYEKVVTYKEVDKVIKGREGKRKEGRKGQK